MTCQKFEEIYEGGDCVPPDRQNNSSGLSAEGGSHSLQDPKWFYEEDPAQVS